MGPLEFFISLLIGSAVSWFSSKDQAEQELRQKTEDLDKNRLVQAIKNRQTLVEQLRLVSVNAAKSLDPDRMSPAERSLWSFLSGESFQNDLADWLVTWEPKEKHTLEQKLARRMAEAFPPGQFSDQQIEGFQKEYFTLIQNVLFSDQKLNNWRMNLALEFLVERLQFLDEVVKDEGQRTRIEIDQANKELALIKSLIVELRDEQRRFQDQLYSKEQRRQVLEKYCGLLLAAADIIDLNNLPADRGRFGVPEFRIRNLYIPLKAHPEVPAQADQDLMAAALDRAVEKRRDNLRRQAEWRLDQAVLLDKPAPAEPLPLGQALDRYRHLVVLGDPGSGKTTLINWLATAYLIRRQNDPAYHQLLAVETLPDQDWLPLVIRCRDLAEGLHSASIDDLFEHTFRQAHLAPEEAQVLRAAFRAALDDGQALILIDGLDEIIELPKRAQFCRNLEKVHLAFPEAPVVVTSRLVGYREMSHRIGRGFGHVTLAELSKPEVDDFIGRWCRVTKLPEEADSIAARLVQEVHRNERLERLIRSPIILTTLLLIRDSIGELPSRRSELYREAVRVLINWRRFLGEPLEYNEALPQLRYLAYAMCENGFLQIPEKEVLSLLEDLRNNHHNLRAVARRSPDEFLKLLEERTAIFVKIGEVKDGGRVDPVYEFRHPTFQEYLAADALAEGYYPGWQNVLPLAPKIGQLAAQTARYEDSEEDVPDNWREALRLTASCCRDSEADEVLLAMSGLADSRPSRARVVLAASCLADQVNASPVTAEKILARLIEYIGLEDFGYKKSIIDRAFDSLLETEWAGPVIRALTLEFRNRQGLARRPLGLFFANKERATLIKEKFNDLTALFGEDQELSRLLSFLVLYSASKIKAKPDQAELDFLWAMVRRGGAWAHAGALILNEINPELLGPFFREHEAELKSIFENPSYDQAALVELIEALAKTKKKQYTPFILRNLNHSESEIRWVTAKALGQLGDTSAVEPLIKALDQSEKERADATYHSGELGDGSVIDSLIKLIDKLKEQGKIHPIIALGKLGDARAVEPLIQLLTDPSELVRAFSASALGQIGDVRAVEPVIQLLAEPSVLVRDFATMALGQLFDDRAVDPLIQLLDDPSEDVIASAAMALGALGDDRAVEPLIQILDDPSEWVKAEAAEALGRIGDARAIDPLKKLLEDPDHEVREAAKEALAEIESGSTPFGSENGDIEET